MGGQGQRVLESSVKGGRQAAAAGSGGSGGSPGALSRPESSPRRLSAPTGLWGGRLWVGLPAAILPDPTQVPCPRSAWVK